MKSLTEKEKANMAKVDQLIKKGVELLTQGLQAFRQFGENYVEVLDKHPEFTKQFKESFPLISSQVFNKFERLGRGQIIPELVFDCNPAAKQLENMPLSSQKQIYGKNLEMVTESGDILKVPFCGLSKVAARQIIAKDHIRTPQEQKLLIETSKKKKSSVKKPEQKKLYEVKNGKLIISEPCSITKDQLIQLLAEM